MKDGRPSLTANLVAAARALHDAQPKRERLFEDGVAVELVPAWLSAPALVAKRAPWSAGVLRAMASVVSAGLTDHVVLRTRAIDDALRASLEHGVGQVVLLGAGLDSRAERMPELANVPVFEIDHPATHAFKVERLERRGEARKVARVAIDFERERIADVLAVAGFDPKIPAFFIWEGVTVYLGVETIKETIVALGELCAPKSRVAVTYSPLKDSTIPRWAEPVGRALATAIGEDLRGFIAPEVIHTFFERSGFEVLSDEDARTWSPRYRPGQKAPRAWERLAIAERIQR